MPIARYKTITLGAISGVLAPLRLIIMQAIFLRSAERPVILDSISE
jgi:hypothetical protein